MERSSPPSPTPTRVNAIWPDKQAWISFNDEHLTGWTGCNELSGTVARTNTKLIFTHIVITDRGYPDDTAAMQTAMLSTLAPAVSYTIDHNHLTLFSATGIGLDLKAGKGR